MNTVVLDDLALYGKEYRRYVEVLPNLVYVGDVRVNGQIRVLLKSRKSSAVHKKLSRKFSAVSGCD